ARERGRDVAGDTLAVHRGAASAHDRNDRTAHQIGISNREQHRRRQRVIGRDVVEGRERRRIRAVAGQYQSRAGVRGIGEHLVGGREREGASGGVGGGIEGVRGG